MARTVDKGEGRRMEMKGAKKRRTRGAVQVEYAFLLLFVMVPTAPILIAGGRQMYEYYKTTRSSILSSTP